MTESSNKKETILFRYNFTFKDNSVKQFDIHLDSQTLALVQPEKNNPPEWTKLDCCKCPICPFDSRTQPYCPIALSLVDIVDFFYTSISYDDVEVRIETVERSYSKNTSMQKALSSIIGIYMPTCGCPVMEKFKPMVRNHLPFSSAAETTYRVMSMYLLAQFLRVKQGMQPDWSMEDLITMYSRVQIVNKSFCDRLTSIKAKDASINAVVLLNSFAGFVQFQLTEDKLTQLKTLFAPYLI